MSMAGPKPRPWKDCSGHSYSPHWDWVAGLRQDLGPRESRSFVAFGLRGMAPQWFEVSATGYVGEGGRAAARLSSGYSLLLTNRLCCNRSWR